ncbi:MAG: amidohydrolase family protein [Myxococcales bacterium]|nr:amidohydrolase family protein [Myxococcales bacterium]MCB9732974.1 amidohydrolase family protein [Deltaproteobacteria bacterium]
MNHVHIMVAGLALLTAPLAARAAAPAAEECTVLVGGRVFDGARWLDGAPTVVLEGGRVRAVGGAAPPGCRVVEVAGKMVTPGLVDAATQIGLVEVPAEGATVDLDLRAEFQDGEHLVRASVRPDFAYNPRSAVIPVTRLGGVTSALVVPRGGVVAGSSFLVDLAGERQSDAIERTLVAMHASVAGGDGSRASALEVLRVALAEATRYDREKAAFEANRTRALLLPWVELAALAPVARGEEPLAVHVDRASDIEGILRFAEGTKLRLLIFGGAEAWLVKDLLKARGVGVVTYPFADGPDGFDRVFARPDNARILDEAGVSVAIASFDAHASRKLRQLAGNAVRAGLAGESGLAAITSRPAALLGLRDRGVLRAGAVANVVVWSGDPLEVTTLAERVFVHGREMPRESRQTRLRDAYRRLPARDGAGAAAP